MQGRDFFCFGDSDRYHGATILGVTRGGRSALTMGYRGRTYGALLGCAGSKMQNAE